MGTAEEKEKVWSICGLWHRSLMRSPADETNNRSTLEKAVDL